ncbi:two-component system response regulator [Vogesella amnigena]|uniref:Two-component system response regulator n=1 Tax=Vogesella amnigena TaxID=1507449 RepID=A0ABV7TRR9_9NEIS
MQTTPLLFVIDDDSLTAQMIEDVLGEQFRVRAYLDPLLALQQVAQEQPDIILLDINMPQMDGYEVCRRLKADFDSQDIPVMFLSGLTTLEDRMAAYDAGGQDFMAKPLELALLGAKLDAMLQHRQQREALVQQASYATATAMTAMSNAAEMGQVVQFARKVMLCQDMPCLARELLDAAASYGLSAAVALRNESGSLEMNQEGELSAMESGVLQLIASCGRIVAMGQRAAFNYGGVTLMIRNMPQDDEDRRGRLRDNLAAVAELAAARLETLVLADLAASRLDMLKLQQQIVEREACLRRVLTSVQAGIGAMEQQRRDDRFAATALLESMLGDLEREYVHLGLTDIQEANLSNLLRAASNRILSLYGGDFQGLESLKQVLAEMPLQAD